MIKGVLYDGNTSQSHTATLEWQNECSLHLRFNNTTHVITWEQIAISPRLGNTARFIELGNFGRFETTDNDAVDELTQHHPDHQKHHFLHRLETSNQWVVAAVVITLLFSVSFIRWGVPWVSDRIAYSLPEKATDLIEQRLLEEFKQRLTQESLLSADRQATVQALYQEAVRELGVENKGYTFFIRRGNEAIGANAFAFPSGAILMTDQLIQLADNDTQIAGVIAHEIGHLELKHSLRQLVRGSLLTILVAWISGDAAGAMSTVIAAPVAFLELNYSREFEVEADRFAIEYFNCDFAALEQMALFFDKLDASHNGKSDDANDNKTPSSDFFSTHPATEKRMAMLRDAQSHVDCF